MMVLLIAYKKWNLEAKKERKLLFKFYNINKLNNQKYESKDSN